MSDETVPVRFTDFPFRESIHEAIAAAGFEQPMPIQAGCIGPVLENKDVIGLAQTGTGKTAAFALPLIQRYSQSLELSVLVLAPTRELAQQITRMFNQLGRTSGTRVAMVYGGVPHQQDYKALASWPNVLVATPGRLIDHIESRRVVLDHIEVLVVDEADRMHDMGFMPQIRRILDELPDQRQTLMFTATMPPDVERIARRHMRSPMRVQVGRRSAPAERAEQQLFKVREDDKTPLLLDLLKKSHGRVLVFVRTKRGTDRLWRAVSRHFDNAACLHSDREQKERDDAMGGFREGRYRILVATDIAARGLDIADIEHVINYDFPTHAEDYVHRVGRTARVAASGLATSFVTPADRRYVAQVERLVQAKLPLSGPSGNGHERSAAPRRRRRSSRGRPRRSGSSGRRQQPAASGDGKSW